MLAVRRVDITYAHACMHAHALPFPPPTPTTHTHTQHNANTGAKVVDSVVLRYARAVTHFSPGSYQDRPYQATSIPNAFIAGDWIKGLQHGANGLSQVRAL